MRQHRCHCPQALATSWAAAAAVATLLPKAKQHLRVAALEEEEAKVLAAATQLRLVQVGA